jgi:DNA replication ATP-dependent helicase Dna2
MAHDYLLIKGYPGTGKTTTIAALIAILVKLEKKILFTSFTNSAVDNLLLKLKNDVCFYFIFVFNLMFL